MCSTVLGHGCTTLLEFLHGIKITAEYKKKFPYKIVTNLIQFCKKNVTALLRECINLARISHRSGNESVKILQQIIKDW